MNGKEGTASLRTCLGDGSFGVPTEISHLETDMNLNNLNFYYFLTNLVSKDNFGPNAEFRYHLIKFITWLLSYAREKP